MPLSFLLSVSAPFRFGLFPFMPLSRLMEMVDYAGFLYLPTSLKNRNVLNNRVQIKGIVNWCIFKNLSLSDGKKLFGE
jgi:hypothetical protein